MKRLFLSSNISLLIFLIYHCLCCSMENNIWPFIPCNKQISHNCSLGGHLKLQPWLLKGLVAKGIDAVMEFWLQHWWQFLWFLLTKLLGKRGGVIVILPLLVYCKKKEISPSHDSEKSNEICCQKSHFSFMTLHPVWLHHDDVIMLSFPTKSHTEYHASSTSYHWRPSCESFLQIHHLCCQQFQI